MTDLFTLACGYDDSLSAVAAFKPTFNRTAEAVLADAARTSDARVLATKLIHLLTEEGMPRPSAASQYRLAMLLSDELDARYGPLAVDDRVETKDGTILTVSRARTSGARCFTADGVMVSLPRKVLRRVPSLHEPVVPPSWCGDPIHNDERIRLLAWTEDGVDD